MTEEEMLQALAPVRREHSKFELTPHRATDWYRRFGHIPLSQFRAMVDRVLDNARYLPTREDFSKAETEVVPRKETSTNEKWVAEYESHLTADGGMQRNTHKIGDRRTAYNFVRKSRMDVILKAFGHEWVNQELGIENQRDCLAFVKAFSVGDAAPSGKSIKHRQLYKDWLEDAFKKAWKAINREEATTEVMSAYV